MDSNNESNLPAPLSQVENQAKWRQLKLKQDWQRLESRLAIMELRLEEAKELRDQYLDHLRRKYPDWHPSLRAFQDRRFEQRVKLRKKEKIVDQLATAKYWTEATSFPKISLHPIPKITPSEGPRVTKDIEMIKERLDEISVELREIGYNWKELGERKEEKREPLVNQLGTLKWKWEGQSYESDRRERIRDIPKQRSPGPLSSEPAPRPPSPIDSSESYSEPSERLEPVYEPKPRLDFGSQSKEKVVSPPPTVAPQEVVEEQPPEPEPQPERKPKPRINFGSASDEAKPKIEEPVAKPEETKPQVAAPKPEPKAAEPEPKISELLSSFTEEKPKMEKAPSKKDSYAAMLGMVAMPRQEAIDSSESDSIEERLAGKNQKSKSDLASQKSVEIKGDKKMSVTGQGAGETTATGEDFMSKLFPHKYSKTERPALVKMPSYMANSESESELEIGKRKIGVAAVKEESDEDFWN